RRKRHFFLDGQFGPDNFPASEKLNGNLFAEGDPMRAIKLLSIAAFLLAVTLLAGRLVTAGSEPPQKKTSTEAKADAEQAGEAAVMVWVRRQTGYQDNPLQREFRINGETIDV